MIEYIIRIGRKLNNKVENLVMNSCERGEEPFYFFLVRLYLKFRWWVFCKFVNSGVKMPDALNILLAQMKKGENFVDIGANVGWVSSAAGFILSGKGQVYGFEPSPKIFKFLNNRIKFLRLNHVTVYNVALGSEDSTGELHEFSENFGGASSLKFGAWVGHEESNVAKVSIKRLDTFFAKEGIEDIGLIKIDVQGAELDVLRGARPLLESINLPVLYVEIEEQSLRAFGFTRADLLKLIWELGYETYCWNEGQFKGIKSLNDLSDQGHDDVICLKEGEPRHDELKVFMEKLSV